MTEPTDTAPQPMTSLGALQASSTLVNTLRRLSLADERPGHAHYISKPDMCLMAADLERLALDLHAVHAERHAREAQGEADAGFAIAIDAGRLSRDPAAPNFAGHYMHMGRDHNGRDMFKHRITRDYLA